jgi:hypothetical protein
MKQAKKKQVITKPVSKTLKVTPRRVPPTEFKGDKRVGDALVITISGPAGISRSYTVHHPIGFVDPDLDAKDWIVSETDYIDSLLTRAKDPKEKELEDRRTVLRWRYLVAKLPKHLKFNDAGEVCYVRETAGATRADLVKLARKAEKDDNKDTEGYKPHGNSYIDYMVPKELRAIEMEVRSALKDPATSEYVNKVAPRTYRTRYPRAHAPDQRKSSLFTKCGRSQELFDQLIKYLEAIEEPKVTKPPVVEEKKDGVPPPPTPTKHKKRKG